MKYLQKIFGLFSFFSFLIVTSLFSPKMALAFSGSGSGTSGSPFLITSCSQLQEIDNSLAAYYQQTQDIDCTGFSFTSIASSGSFTGTLDGQGYTISNLTISGGSGLFGLFSNTGAGAVIKNAHLSGGSVSAGSSSYSASFVANADGSLTISDSSSSMTSTGESACGLVSLVSSGTTTITRSSYTGNMTTDWVYGGGLVGIALTSTVNISDSFTSGTYQGQAYEGGLVGYMQSGSIASSYSTATITANGGTYVGGLVGF